MHASYRYHDSYQETILVHDDMTFNALYLAAFNTIA